MSDTKLVCMDKASHAKLQVLAKADRRNMKQYLETLIAKMYGELKA
ncbi:hypothetical protein [Paenibacillus sp. Soil787]|nr:hypothetical protein [Paenibacillus sp. Soil787]